MFEYGNLEDVFTTSMRRGGLQKQGKKGPADALVRKWQNR